MLLRARSRGARCAGGSSRCASPARRFRLPRPAAPAAWATNESPLLFSSISSLWPDGTGGRKTSGSELGVDECKSSGPTDGWKGALVKPLSRALMSKSGSLMAERNACKLNAEKSMFPVTMGSGTADWKPKDASPLVSTRAVDASPGESCSTGEIHYTL